MSTKAYASQYSVVVLGTMNPAIHHPFWYQATGMISPSDAETAQNVVVLPQLARFRTAGLGIQCLPDRWQIETGDVGQRSRLAEIAANTFERLRETPVAGFGINSKFEIDAGLRDVGDVVGAQLLPLLKQFGNHGAPHFDSLSISYPLPPLELPGQPKVSRQLKATISTSEIGPNAVTINSNADHRIEPKGMPMHFDLDVLLKASFDIQEGSDALVEHLTTALQGLGE